MFQQALSMLVQKWDFFGNLLLQHVVISASAIIYATIIGLVTGILISEYQKASKPTLALVNLLYTIPSLALLGLLIPFTGVGDTTAIIALTVYGLLPMVKNTNTGLNNVDPAVIEAAKGMGSTRKQILFKIKLPLAMPVIMTGFRNMVTMTIAVTTIASFIGAGGLGVAIYRGITTNNMPMVLAGSILVAALAIVVDLLVGLIEHSMYRNNQKASKWRTVVDVLVVVVLVGGLAAYGGIKSSIQNANTDKTIKVADKSYTEQLVLGQMLSQYIEADTDLNVELTSGISGGTATIQPAMLKGDYDLYPEYTGTVWNMVLGNTVVYHEDMFDQLQSAYEDMGLQWVGLYGFEDTYGIAVRTDIAEKYGLETYSDLVGVADKLKVGAEYDFYDRLDGYYALCNAYGFQFGSTMDLDTGLKYKAIASGDVDALIIYTTDGQLEDADVKILKDDKGFFPSYSAGTIVRQETLQKHPELKATLNRLNGVLDEKTMANLNYQVDSEGREPYDVAHDFLVSSGLIAG